MPASWCASGPGLTDGVARVDGETEAGRIARLVGRQPQNRVAHVHRVHQVDGQAVFEEPDEMRSSLLNASDTPEAPDHVGVGSRWMHGVDADAMLRQLVGEGLGESYDPELRSHIGSVEGQALDPCRGTRDDD